MPPASYTPPASSGRTAYATYPIWQYGNSVQAAINAAHAAGGGTVFVPRGSWIQTATLTTYDGVNLAGEGMTAGGTELKWTADLGFGNWGIVRGSGTLNQLGSGPEIRDIQLTGPFNQTITPDAPPQSATVGMDGMQAMAVQERVQVRGFRSGITIRDSHERFLNCVVGSNFYNILYMNHPTVLGNQWFDKCELAAAQYACIAIEGSNVMDNISMRDSYMGIAPYGIWKGNDPGAVASTQHAIVESVFDNVGFEGQGNSFIRDVSTGVGFATFYNIDWRFMGGAYNRSYKITANPVAYGFDVRSFAGRNKISTSVNPPQPGSAGVWNIGSISGPLEFWDFPLNGVPTTPTTFTVGGTDDANVIYHPASANGSEYGSVVLPSGSGNGASVNVTTPNWVGPLRSLELQYGVDDLTLGGTPTSFFTLLGRILNSLPGNGNTQLQFLLATGGTATTQPLTIRWRLR